MGMRSMRYAMIVVGIWITGNLIRVHWGYLAFIGGGLSVGLGLYYLRAAGNFSQQRNDVTAKKLLRASLLYLPLYMLVLIIACLS